MQVTESFIISHSLQKHPVSSETTSHKMKYLGALESFVYKYSKDDDVAFGMLENYKSVLLGSETEHKCCANDPNKALQWSLASRWSFKKLRFVTYRYCLLCDVVIMNAFGNAEKAQRIRAEIELMCKGSHNKQFAQLFDVLYNDSNDIRGLDMVDYHIDCWRKNVNFMAMPEHRVAITANMSAGKSTLINALVGKVVNRTMNDACTAKVHCIYDQAYEDYFTHEWDYEINLNADKKALMEDDKRNTRDTISVATYFQMLSGKTSRLCIIDTPGVNSATDKAHGELTKGFILSAQYDLLIFVINAENAGTDDDYSYLSYIKENIAEDKIIFALNKLDSFDAVEDSVEDSVVKLKNELVGLGFENPVICPVSSYAGLLAKKKLHGGALSKYETSAYHLLVEKFADPFYDLSKFYRNADIKSDNADVDILVRCGLYGLEQIILQRS